MMYNFCSADVQSASIYSLLHFDYNIQNNHFYQDNQSAMKMEMNGLKSCGEKSRHINIRYFFIADLIKRENIQIRHCPTERMIADYFTKPLQGKLFVILRDQIMGISDTPMEERVGNNEAKKISIGASTTPTRKRDVSWADVVKGNEYMKKTNDNSNGFESR